MKVLATQVAMVVLHRGGHHDEVAQADRADDEGLLIFWHCCVHRSVAVPGRLGTGLGYRLGSIQKASRVSQNLGDR